MLTSVLVGIDCLCLYALADNCQSQWPRGLRRRSAAAAGVLGLRFGIRQGLGCVSVVSVVSVVCCECCVL